ncbi:MAG: ABC transporter substrate-binding protein, partial [Conexibacteraceae bacterium]|nr:ABC transporter substrate-binding protein [Conexibacteraceae bacterium]
MLISTKVQAVAGTLVLGASVAVAALSAGPALARQHAQAAAAGTLVMESSPVGASTGFNPFQPHSNAYTVGSVSLIYEPLFQENLAHPANAPYPFLATHYAWGDKGKSITFTIRQGVKWSDGTAFSAADVAFTYNLLKANPSISGIGSPIKSVTQSGDKVTLTFPTAQYANFQAIATAVFIVPQHIWSSAGNPATYLDSSPVGTGPYVVKSFDTSGIVMTKNPNYWGGPFGGKGPAVQTVEFPALPSNTNALTNLITGSVQWSGNFLPGFAQATKGKGVVNYSPPGNTNAFWPNLGQWPTNNLAVRQAISDAIDRTTIGTQGEAGLEAPATSAGGLTLPTFQPFLASGVAKLDTHANAKAAGKVLKAAGFTKSGKYWALKGKIVKLSITDPSSYSDYKADDILAASELQKAGIDATCGGQGQTQWQEDVTTGNFQQTQ